MGNTRSTGNKEENKGTAGNGGAREAGGTGGEFSVEQAAVILGCSRSMVYQLRAEGVLKGPDGRPRNGESALVSEKSLFQFVFLNRISRYPLKTLNDLKNGRKNFRRMFSKNDGANCLSSVEGKEHSPDLVLQGVGGNNSTEPKRCMNHEFAEQHQFSFGWLAWQMAPHDLALRDDLVQEMSLAVLEFERPASFEYLFELATNRAINYIKYESLRGMLPLSAVEQMSDGASKKVASLNVFIDDLIETGVPAEWIEEVLGERLKAA